MGSEALALELRPLDFDSGTLRLVPGMTENDEGRWCTSPPSSSRCSQPQIGLHRAIVPGALRPDRYREGLGRIFGHYGVGSHPEARATNCMICAAPRTLSTMRSTSIGIA